MRYKDVVLDKEGYLLSLSRYLVLNPLRLGLVQRPEEWPWSSYRATIGEGKRVSFLEANWILSQFGDERKRAIRRCRDYVLEGIKGEFPWRALLRNLRDY